MRINKNGHNCFRWSQMKEQNSVLPTTDQENTHANSMLFHNRLECVIPVSVKERVTKSWYN